MKLAQLRDQKSMTVTSINVAASETAEDKLKTAKTDAADTHKEALDLLEEIKLFCVKTHRKNAFLVRLESDHPTYQLVEKPVALRFFTYCI